ncbi:hypothetical protein [Nonomuraea jiangxiensis]|uniref:Sialidase-1 n=1 Tax=Nonomuraea jiangxiensis TaxID=633440 RepID=A0A1G8HM74_9ACTN|nr:hypothetical protein [Nonomuraea jiangxiensis]SDI07796.1 sialidase-1 [Nonomuraea jiangxiensis]
MRTLAKVFVTLGVLACGIAATSPAQASAAAVDPAAVCGSGFRVIDSHAFTSSGTALGTIYLSYNAGSGKNCVVTVNKTSTPMWMRASLSVQNGGSDSDSGVFRYYAGPVTLSAADKCVRWGGTWDEAPYTWTSGWSHCG